MKKILIANRGEIAVRLCRAIQEMGHHAVGVVSEDDQACQHARLCDSLVVLEGKGAAAYLDVAQLVSVALDHQCAAVHPGYGFLSENAAFASAVRAAGLVYVGPSAEALQTFGDKTAAREAALAVGLPVLPGCAGSNDPALAGQLLQDCPDGIMLKAVAGGGGRGMRVVADPATLDDAFKRSSAEAQAAFGVGEVYAERYVARARHIEVQVLGDGSQVSHLYDRECSLQRRHQKIVEFAPAVGIDETLRKAMQEGAIRLAAASGYAGLGTVEYLLDEAAGEFFFMECNARLQVEHTVTEAVLGLDLVQLQMAVAFGASLSDLQVSQAQVPQPRGMAVQLRVNTERLTPAGEVQPTGGLLSQVTLPSGPGVRVDGYAYSGYVTNPNYDSLLVKLVVHSPQDNWQALLLKATRTLDELQLEGVETNQPLLRRLLAHEQVVANALHTTFIDANLDALLQAEAQAAPEADFDAADPLAVLEHGKSGSGGSVGGVQILQLREQTLAAGQVAINAPMQGTVVSYEVEPGDEVHVGKLVLIMEAMKMEHEVVAGVSGVVQALGVEPGDTVFEGHPLLVLSEQDVVAGDDQGAVVQDLDEIRADLQEVFDRLGAGYDENRPEAVAKRRKTGHRTARENVADLCDEGTFVEYGGVVVAAQRRRRKMEDLIANTTGDGMVCGLGQVNGHLFDEDRSRTMIMSYDYMVLAGTQGAKNHQKKDRLFEIAEQYQLPTVLFAEGGGGRPGDTDGTGVAGLDCWAFTYFARLSGLVPLVGITTGRCFAGNAVLLGCCDVIIATEDANIGIGGPAMIEGGGLGVFRPEEVGPMDVQVPNGVVDIAVKDEAEAVAKAKQYLSYFQGPVSEWEAPDARKLRFVVPENRLRYYDMREVIEGIADVDSVLELRPNWGIGIITCFIRVEGRPMGLIANNPAHLSGAIDAPGADKGARFLQLCDAFDLPVLSLCDCPGIMVGPEIEKTAIVRHAARMMVTSANVDIPLMTIVTRKGYGLGAQAMAGGSFKAPLFTVTWPTGEFGGMGLEGAVKLGYRKELQAIEDPAERATTYEKMVDDMYQRGKAVNMASHFELDAVIDPAESRSWIVRGLKSVPAAGKGGGKKRPNVDTW